MVFLKLFDLSSTGLEIMIVVSFFRILKKEENIIILKMLKISEQSKGRFTVK